MSTVYRIEIVKDFELPEQDDAWATREAHFAAEHLELIPDDDTICTSGKPASVRLIDVSAPDSAGRVVWTNEP